MIDTHTHLYLPEYGEEVKKIIEDCTKTGVNHLILPNIDLESINHLKNFHLLYPYITSMAMGLHPTEVKDDWEKTLNVIENEIKTGEYKAIGEVGIDLYWEDQHKKDQIRVFELQLQMAEKYNLPVIIHSRNAYKETVEVISKVKPNVPLIFHSFTGSKEDVKTIRQICDPYFGINGVVTYKNAKDLREALPLITLERIILETDSPYLTPVPHRGKKNNSSYLYYIRDKVADILRVTTNAIESKTDSIACTIFGL